VIGLLVLAGCLSAPALLLAVLAFSFGSRSVWAWFGLCAASGFWLWIGGMIYIGHRRSQGAS